MEVKLKATVSETMPELSFHFGHTYGSVWLPGRGKVQRKLKLRVGDDVEIIIRKKKE